MHTSESSACGHLTAAQQVLQYKKAGYDAVIITDHFINGNSAVDRSLPWKQQMEDQFKGYRNAKIKGDEVGLKVFEGIEYAYHGTEFIVLGLGEKWFKDHEEIKEFEPKDFLKVFRDAGAAVIQAHPYREASYIKEIRLFPDLVDAVEVFNYHNDILWNNRAKAYAYEHNLPMTAGSDCHDLNEYSSGIACDKEINTLDELVALIKSGKGWNYFENIRTI
ncbi:MAG: histidinol-phosphatase [Saccharofermentans sp.]|nr:histidinol-phosphatase [Saccharofermentans sp.]